MAGVVFEEAGLFGQNQFILTGDPQPVSMAGVVDQDFLLAVKQRLTVIVLVDHMTGGGLVD